MLFSTLKQLSQKSQLVTPMWKGAFTKATPFFACGPSVCCSYNSRDSSQQLLLLKREERRRKMVAVLQIVTLKVLLLNTPVVLAIQLEILRELILLQLTK
jgi:hypothetical protein